MPKITENKAIKRNKILDSAYNLFTSKSFATTTIDDVVKMAGVAKGTFYLYFKDKYDLLDRIITYKGAGLIGYAIEKTESSENFSVMNLEEKVLSITEYICDYFEMHREYAALLEKKLSSCLYMFFNDARGEYKELSDKLLSVFVLTGYDLKEAKITAYLITDLIGSTMCDAVLGKCPFTVSELRPSLNRAVKGLLRR